MLRLLSIALILGALQYSSLVANDQIVRITNAAYKIDTTKLTTLILDANIEKFGSHKFKLIKDVSQVRAVSELSQNNLIDLA